MKTLKLGVFHKLLFIYLCTLLCAEAYAGDVYVYQLKECDILLKSPSQLILEREREDVSPVFTTGLCKMRFKVKGQSKNQPWALLAVLNGSLQSSVENNSELPWHATEKPSVLEFFQAGHPQYKPTRLPDGRQLLFTTYGVMNCRRIEDTGSMAMCDSEAGLISNGQRTLFIDLDASEANLSVELMLKRVVFINSKTRGNPPAFNGSPK